MVSFIVSVAGLRGPLMRAARDSLVSPTPAGSLGLLACQATARESRQTYPTRFLVIKHHAPNLLAARDNYSRVVQNGYQPSGLSPRRPDEKNITGGQRLRQPAKRCSRSTMPSDLRKRPKCDARHNQYAPLRAHFDDAGGLMVARAYFLAVPCGGMRADHLYLPTPYPPPTSATTALLLLRATTSLSSNSRSKVMGCCCCCGLSCTSLCWCC